uniref:Adaptor related protein complex 2 subunit beta 1 n=2 Tax=Poecilia TaxID=8080 RepID=A0A087X6D4_POEFO
MTDSKYFTTNKKGEIFELKAELNNEKKEKRKEAVKKVIAAMTVGKDVRYTSRLDFECYLGSFHPSIFCT